MSIQNLRAKFLKSLQESRRYIQPLAFEQALIVKKSQDLEYAVDGPSPQGSREGWSITNSDRSFFCKMANWP